MQISRFEILSILSREITHVAHWARITVTKKQTKKTTTIDCTANSVKMPNITHEKEGMWGAQHASLYRSAIA